MRQSKHSGNAGRRTKQPLQAKQEYSTLKFYNRLLLLASSFLGFEVRLIMEAQLHFPRPQKGVAVRSYTRHWAWQSRATGQAGQAWRNIF